VRPRRHLLYGSQRYALAILRPVQHVFRARGADVAWYFDGPGASDLTPDETLLRTVRDVRAWQPDSVLTSGNEIPHVFPGAKVEVFHGFDAGKPGHHRVRGFFDLLCTTGPAETEAFRRLAGARPHFAVAETGWPKLDALLRSVPPWPPPTPASPPTILYHSTFSPSWSAAETLYPIITRLAASGRWRWVVTLHPKMSATTVAKYRALEGPHLRYSLADNIHDEFGADVMISDTSSAMYEYLLTWKPVVTFRTRRPVDALIDVAEPDDLEPAIERALARPPDLMTRIRRFAEALHPWRDGWSAERVADAVEAFVAGGRAGLHGKPLNLWRKLRIRARLGYWGPA
jgi:CDP-glycerol glycerophosphotransferase (TagB/SpsB family)